MEIEHAQDHKNSWQAERNIKLEAQKQDTH